MCFNEGPEQVQDTSIGLRRSHTSSGVLRCQAPGVRGEEKLAYDFNGQVTVFIGWEGFLQGDEMKVCLEQLLASVIPPVEVVYLGGNIAFARYHHMSEAERVISCCHGAVVCGIRLTVKPPRRKMHSNDSSSSSRRQERGGKVMTDSRHSSLRSISPHDNGRGVLTRRGRVSPKHRSSASLDSRMQAGGFPTSTSNGGCLDAASSPVQTTSGDREMQNMVGNNILSSKSHDILCDLGTESCDRFPEGSLASPRSLVWDTIPPAVSYNLANNSHVQKSGGSGEMLNSLSNAEYLEWDSLLAKPCDISHDAAVGSTHCKSRNELISERKAKPYSRAEAERLIALISDTDSDGDSLLNFDWDNSLLDDVKTSSDPSVPSSSLTTNSISLPPSTSFLPRSSPPPLLFPIPSSAPLVSKDSDSFLNSSGSILSESDLASWGSWNEPSAISVNERAQQKYSTLGVASNLVPATVSKMESPDMMWLQMTSDPKRDLDHISGLIVRAKPPKLTQVKLGGLCCFKLHLPKQGKTLSVRRAMIHENLEKHVNDPQVGVIMIDVGTSQECAVRDLYVLPDCVQLEIYPSLACARALKGVVSCYHDREMWFSQDLDKMKSHLNQRMVYVNSVTPTTFSKCGCGLIDVYFDPQGVRNVADLILAECYFVTKPEPDTGNTKTDSHDGKSSSQNGTGNIKTDSHDGKPSSQNGIGTGHIDESDMWSLRPRGKRRSLMAMVTHAVSHLESLQMKPGK